MEFMYLVFTRMPGESFYRRLGSLSLCILLWSLCTKCLGAIMISSLIAGPHYEEEEKEELS